MQEPFSHPTESKLLKTGWIEIYSVYQVTSIRFPHADDAQIVFILDASSETQGRSVVGPGEKIHQSFQAWAEGVFRSCLKTFAAPFLPARLGLQGWTRQGLKNVCVERFEVTGQQRDLKEELTLLTSVPASPFVFRIAEGRGTPYNGLHGEAPPEKGSFFSLRCKREGVYSFKSRLSLRSRCRSIGRG